MVALKLKKHVFGKKAYLKTLEAFLALIITFAFVLYLIPTPENDVTQDTSTLLSSMIKRETFRVYAANLTTCIYKGENTSINVLLDTELKTYINYSICLQGDIPSLPRKKVNVESVYITGNLTDRNDRIIKLYYWE